MSRASATYAARTGEEAWRRYELENVYANIRHEQDWKQCRRCGGDFLQGYLELIHCAPCRAVLEALHAERDTDEAIQARVAALMAVYG